MRKRHREEWAVQDVAYVLGICFLWNKPLFVVGTWNLSEGYSSGGTTGLLLSPHSGQP